MPEPWEGVLYKQVLAENKHVLAESTDKDEDDEDEDAVG
mgnify:CR=1 FL=1